MAVEGGIGMPACQPWGFKFCQAQRFKMCQANVFKMCQAWCFKRLLRATRFGVRYIQPVRGGGSGLGEGGGDEPQPMYELAEAALGGIGADKLQTYFEEVACLTGG